MRSGNALYAVGDPAFASFAKNSRGAFKVNTNMDCSYTLPFTHSLHFLQPYDSFDQSLFAKYQQDPKPYAHLFVYSSALIALSASRRIA